MEAAPTCGLEPDQLSALAAALVAGVAIAAVIGGAGAVRPQMRAAGAAAGDRLTERELLAVEKTPALLLPCLRSRIMAQNRSELAQLLMLCAYRGHARVAKEILAAMLSHVAASASPEAGPETDADAVRRAAERTCRLAMMMAAREGRRDVIHMLLSAGLDLDLDATNSHGSTALILACHGGHSGIAEELLDRGVDANVVNRFGRTALAYACEHNLVGVVDKLCASPKFEIRTRDSLAVRCACDNGHFELACSLLRRSGRLRLPAPKPAMRAPLLRQARAMAVETAQSCRAIMLHDDYAALPAHLRALVVTMALGNGLVLAGPQRGKEQRLASLVEALAA